MLMNKVHLDKQLMDTLKFIYCQPISLMMRKEGTISRFIDKTLGTGKMPGKFAKVIDSCCIPEFCKAAWSVYLELWDDGAITVLEIKNRDYLYDEKTGEFLG